MAGKKKNLHQIIIAAAVLAVVAGLYLAYYLFFAPVRPAAVNDSGAGQFKPVSAVTISALKELTACGNWPLIAVNLSAERGNPFGRRSTVLPQMAATSGVYCLPVNQ